MRYMTIAGVLVVLATQAQAESKRYRLELIPEKSVQSCSRWGQTYTVDVSNAVLTLGTSLMPRGCFPSLSKATARLLRASWYRARGLHLNRQWCVRTHRPTHPLLLSTCAIYGGN